MSAGSRRKQNKPQRVDNPPLISNRINGITESTVAATLPTVTSSLDSHVCGQCCAQFFNLQDFVQHKATCSGEWPAALGAPPKSDSTAPSLSEKSDEVSSSDRLSSDDSAVDLTIKKSVSEIFTERNINSGDANDRGEATKEIEEQEDKLQTVLDSLQQQQIMQLKLIKRICSRVMPESSGLDCLPSNFISPPDSNGTEEQDSVEKESNSQQLRDEQICEICQEICCSKGALLWHTMHAHPSHRPFRCDICSERFSTRRKIRAHIEQHKYSNWLQRSRARSASPSRDSSPARSEQNFGDGGRRSAPPLNDDSEEALTSIVADKSRDSDTDESPSNGEMDDMTSYSDISQASTPITQPPERPLDLSFGFNELNNVFKNGGHNFTLPMSSQEMKQDHNPFINSFAANRGFGFMPGGGFPSAPLAVPSMPGVNGQGGSMYSPVKEEDDWESMMEVCQTDEAEKIRQLVGDKPQPPVTDPNQCLICRRILSCKSALQMHYRTHTGQRPFKCKICLRAFTTKGNLKTHMGVHRSKHPFRMHHQCPICQKRFLNAVLLQQHIRLHTTQLRASQPPAQSRAPPISEGVHPDPKHAEPQAPPPPVSQPITSLGASLMSPSGGLQANGAIRLPLMPQPYPFSPVMLPVSQQQLSMMTGRPGTTCNICYKVFACNSALEIHYRSHTKERPFKCDACGRGFSTKGNMKQHLLTHKIRDMPDSRSDTQSTTPSEIDTKPPIGLQDSQPPAMETTSLYHRIYEEDRFKSEDFGSDSQRNEENTKVEPSNDGENIKNPCDLKSQESLTSGDGDTQDPSPLDAIQRMWAQTEPPPPRKPPILSKHQCGVCFKHFSSSSALQIHMRTHTGDKPFKCNVCSRAFTTKGNLKVHMGTHMWQNPSRRGRRIFDLPGSPGSHKLVGEYSRLDNEDSSRDGETGSPPVLENEYKNGRSNGDSNQRSDTPENHANGVREARNSQPNLTAASSIQKILSSGGFPPIFPNVSFPSSLPSVSVPIPSPFLSGRKSFTGPDAAFSCSGAAQSFPFYPPPHHPTIGRFPDSQSGAVGGFGRGDSMETMMWMWRNVCSVCQRICSSPAELEEHLKMHLQGPRSAAAV